MIAHSKALFSSLERNNVKYMVIGGVAAILHGVPCMTVDIDIFIEASLENARCMLNTLQDLGYETSDLVTPEGVVAVKLLMFENGIKIDVMLQIPGVTFEMAWANKEVRYAGEQAFYVISKADLIAAKRASGRQQDLADVVALGA